MKRRYFLKLIGLFPWGIAAPCAAHAVFELPGAELAIASGASEMDTIGRIDQAGASRINVIGVGGAGGNFVDRMVPEAGHEMAFIAANTDAQALAHNAAPVKICLGRTGLGAGASPHAGKQAAEESKDEIRAALQGSDLVIILAGMGGGTGTGGSPVIGEIAREMGIRTGAVVTKPFHFEGPKRMKKAEAGIARLVKHVDSLIVVHNDEAMALLDEDVSLDECFRATDALLMTGVRHIVERSCQRGFQVAHDQVAHDGSARHLVSSNDHSVA